MRTKFPKTYEGVIEIIESMEREDPETEIISDSGTLLKMFKIVTDRERIALVKVKKNYELTQQALLTIVNGLNYHTLENKLMLRKGVLHEALELLHQVRQ